MRPYLRNALLLSVWMTVGFGIGCMAALALGLLLALLYAILGVLR